MDKKPKRSMNEINPRQSNQHLAGFIEALYSGGKFERKNWGCWPWLAPMQGGNIPIVWYQGVRCHIRKLFWQFFHNRKLKDIDGYYAHMSCGNTKCVNPQHIKLR